MTEDDEAGLIPGLQRAVNVARKAEGKVKRVSQEKAERQQQWKDWEAKLRKTYARERGRFQAAMNKLDQDLADAVRQQNEARAAVRLAAAGDTLRAQMDAAPMTWNSML